MIVISDALVLAPGSADLNAPVVGWQTALFASNVTASFADVNFPITNVANPSTYLKWKSTSTLIQHVTVSFPAPLDADYFAIAGHNFGSGQVAAKVEGAVTIDTQQMVMLHFEGADAATATVDSNAGGSAHTWTPHGNAQLDTADKQFGISSGLFDGTGDFWDTPDHADFTLGSGNWTIDFWFKCVATTGSFERLAGQMDGADTSTLSAWNCLRLNDNRMFFSVFVAGVQTSVTSVRTFTNLINPGWHHMAVVRSGNLLLLFIDGVLEASSALTGTINNSAANLAVGGYGSIPGDWNGWLDEFRMVVGRAEWTANFTPDGAPYDTFLWQTVGDEQLAADDTPMMWRFAPGTFVALRLTMDPTSVFPEIAVAYAGELLELERRIYVGHRVLKYNRKTNVVTGFSDDATFLGRIVLGKVTESSLSLQNITASFYRTDIDPWLSDAVQRPFFFAWRPTSYPEEVGFCWLTGDATMSNQRANGMVQATANLRGIVQ
jgi:hypothetical protein